MYFLNNLMLKKNEKQTNEFQRYVEIECPLTSIRSKSGKPSKK